MPAGMASGAHRKKLQVLQASANRLQPKQPYVLALSTQADGGGCSNRSPLS
jgi:hypothetical protein